MVLTRRSIPRLSSWGLIDKLEDGLVSCASCVELQVSSLSVWPKTYNGHYTFYNLVTSLSLV